MAVTNTAAFPQLPRTVSGICTAAKTTYNDNTNLVTLCTAHATNGSVLTSLTAIARATVTATQLQLYISQDAGTTWYLLDTELMAAYTMAQTTKETKVSFPYSEAVPLRLGPGEKLGVAIGVALAGGVVFTAQLTDF